MLRRLCTALLAWIALWCLAASQKLVPAGNISVPLPGLLNIYTHESADPTATYSILASSYDLTPDSYDDAWTFVYPGQYMTDNFTTQLMYRLSNIMYWPKEIIQVPADVFTFAAVSTADGSLIDGKTVGTVYVTDVSNVEFPGTYDLVQDTENFMYHDMIWKQCDDYGRLDIITCRVHIDQDTVIAAEFISLIHPEFPQNDLSASWTARILKESACDTNLVEARLSSGVVDYDVIFTTGFYSLKLAFFWTIDLYNTWYYTEDIFGGVIDSGRQFYDVQMIDLNRDGKVEVVTTVASNTDGSVEAWEIPSDFRNSSGYARHVLWTGFVPRYGGENGRAPGVVRQFWPTTNTAVKPYLLVSGGDDGRAYYLRPHDEDPLNWTYHLETVTDRGAGQVVSGVAVVDVDGDGYKEIFVSSHNENFVEVFSFKPAD